MMIEETILGYLSQNMTVPCYMMRPETLPEKYIVIEKTGSSAENRITTSTIAIQSYAGKLAQAALLNEEVKAAMDGIVALNSVSNVALVSDYNFTNTETKQPRYQAVYEITHY